MSEVKQIKFKDLKGYEHCQTFIVCGAEVADTNEVEEFIHKIGFVPEDVHVKDVFHLSDNVNGENGRTDYLVTLNTTEFKMNCMKRLMYGQIIKWTSDFIDNYKQDYKSKIK